MVERGREKENCSGRLIHVGQAKIVPKNEEFTCLSLKSRPVHRGVGVAYCVVQFLICF